MRIRALMSGLLAIGAVLAGAVAAGGAMAADKLAGAKLVQALRAGGYVVYFRHTETGADTPDQLTATIGDCATQRNLNEVGRRQAGEIGAAFRNLGIPVGEVLSSEFCRAWQHAELSFGRHIRIAGLSLPKGGPDYTEAQRKRMRAALLPLLVNQPSPGTNRIVIAHDDNLPAAGGPDIEVQGEAVIVKPGPRGRFRVVARLLPDAWSALPTP